MDLRHLRKPNFAKKSVLLNICAKLGKLLGEQTVKKLTAPLGQRIVSRIADEGSPSKGAYYGGFTSWAAGGRIRGFLEVNAALGIETPMKGSNNRATAACGRLARMTPMGIPRTDQRDGAGVPMPLRGIEVSSSSR